MNREKFHEKQHGQPSANGKKPWIRALASPALSLSVCAVHAQEADREKRWKARFQATCIWQRKSFFRAAYSGPNSLLPSREKACTFSRTACRGWRPASGLQRWFNPEVVQGMPFSGLHGFGGFRQWRAAKGQRPDPAFYRPDWFVRKIWALGGNDLLVQGETNQFAKTSKQERLVPTAGNLAVPRCSTPTAVRTTPAPGS